uniref:CoA transferase n=1 Tax=uncultured Planktomarina sp. TaxID=1538529 RepID=UPI003261CFB8
ELLNASLADLFRQRTAETWLTALRKVNIPGGRINDVTDALATKQAEERQLVQSFSTEGGQVCAVRYPVRAEGLCTEVTPPPKLGEGGEALLRNWLAR